MILYGRLYIRENGDVEIRRIPACKCDEKSRGPVGGVCGNCGNAILSEIESGRSRGPANNVIMPYRELDG